LWTARVPHHTACVSIVIRGHSDSLYDTMQSK
jgi:hypothetical protein